MHSSRIARAALLIVGGGLLIAPATASSAVTVDFTLPATSPSAILGITVTDPSSDVTVGTNAVGTLEVTATNPITPGANCAAGAVPTVVTCVGPSPLAPTISYTGGPGDDRLALAVGLDLATNASGGPGSDTISTNAGADDLRGGDGNDFLAGGDGSDTLDGGAGDDTLDGGAGDDALAAGPGNDRVLGGLGNDALDTFDGGIDGPVSCGDGADLVFADNFMDAIDLASCETVAPEFAPGDPSILPADTVQGQTLTAAASPSGTASAVALQWLRCAPTGDLATCAFIDGANAAAYTLTASDVGATIRVGAEATNAAGSDTRASAPTGVVRGLAAAPPLPVPGAAVAAARRAARHTLSGRVAAVRCGGRVCRVRLIVRGPASRVRADLRRGAHQIARVSRPVHGTTIVLTLRARRPLAPGTYTVAVRLTGLHAPPRTFRRTVHVP